LSPLFEGTKSLTVSENDVPSSGSLKSDAAFMALGVYLSLLLFRKKLKLMLK